MSDYLADGTPLLVAAPTGVRTRYGGKTALVTWMADNPLRERDLVIFGNFKQDSIASVLEDYTEVSSVDGVANAMASGERRIILTPADHDWAAVSERLEAFIRALPADMSKAVVLDEGPELDEDALLSFVRVHGNGANCKTVVMAQSPTDVAGSVVKNTVLVWVGPMPGSYHAWLRSHDLEMHADALGAHEPYEWSVLLGPEAEDRDTYNPVPARYGEV